ncbi:MAG TPA: hypothetical protein VIF57_14880 [Polyangia bacterium]
MSFVAVVVLAVGPAACGGSKDGGGSGASACLSCAMKACPTQAAACDASPGCKALRACSLACRMGDSACQNACTTAVAGDTTAITTGANYLSCAQVACPSECSGSSASGSAGTSGGTAGTTGSGGQGGAVGTGGSTGTAGSGGASGSACADADARLAACNTARTDPCSDTDPFSQCFNTCIANASSCTQINAATGPFADCGNTCTITAEQGNVFALAAGGYVTAGAWKGYAWTATDGVSSTTISPANFSTVAAGGQLVSNGGQLCVSGTVAGTSDYSAVAILGISINQAQGMPAPTPSTWTPTGQMIAYSITNPGGSPLRVQLQAAGGDTDATKRWCKNVNGNLGTPYWFDFNTKCWDGTGTYYDGTTPLQSVMVLVPGDLVPVPFNFCINAITPHP